MTRLQAFKLAAGTAAILAMQAHLMGSMWADTTTALAALAVAWPTAFWVGELMDERTVICHECADVFAGLHPYCRTTNRRA